MTIEDPGPPYSDHPKLRDVNERALSSAIEKAFAVRFAKAPTVTAYATTLAESIQRSLDNEAGLIGDGFRVQFAASGTRPETAIKTNQMKIVDKAGQSICRIDVLNPDTGEFDVVPSTDAVGHRFYTYWRQHSVPSLLQAVAEVVVASVSEADYLRRKGPADARKFMPQVS